MNLLGTSKVWLSLPQRLLGQTVPDGGVRRRRGRHRVTLSHALEVAEATQGLCQGGLKADQLVALLEDPSFEVMDADDHAPAFCLQHLICKKNMKR